MRALLILFAVALVGCETPPHWEIQNTMVVPDSLRDEVAQCIQATVTGSSRGLTTVDYEDVDDTIEAAAWACERAYSHPVRCLALVSDHGYAVRVISPSEMTASEHAILDSLLAN